MTVSKDSTTAIDFLWVPVGDRQPRDGQYVIVWIDRSWSGKAGSAAGRCHYFDGEGFELPDAGGVATHWQPWPQTDPAEIPDAEERLRRIFQGVGVELPRTIEGMQELADLIGGGR